MVIVLAKQGFESFYWAILNIVESQDKRVHALKTTEVIIEILPG